MDGTTTGLSETTTHRFSVTSPEQQSAAWEFHNRLVLCHHKLMIAKLKTTLSLVVTKLTLPYRVRSVNLTLFLWKPSLQCITTISKLFGSYQTSDNPHLSKSLIFSNDLTFYFTKKIEALWPKISSFSQHSPDIHNTSHRNQLAYVLTLSVTFPVKRENCIFACLKPLPPPVLQLSSPPASRNHKLDGAFVEFYFQPLPLTWKFPIIF